MIGPMSPETSKWVQCTPVQQATMHGNSMDMTQINFTYKTKI